MIDINKPHRNLGCEVCEDDDHCLPRWEDDGGVMNWQPPHEQGFEEDPESDHGYRNWPSVEWRYQTI